MRIYITLWNISDENQRAKNSGNLFNIVGRREVGKLRGARRKEDGKTKNSDEKGWNKKSKMNRAGLASGLSGL